MHLGNLRTALIAWLVARTRQGRFLLRIEDLDTPRVVPGSAEKIIQDLQWLGIDWDEPPLYQSRRTESYAQALDELHQQKKLFACFCSRKELREIASAPHGDTAVYPGSCRALTNDEIAEKAKHKSPAIRVRVPDQTITFVDHFKGEQRQNLASAVGDFVIKRADGLFAYQLAVVVDDLHQGVTDIVRGTDLISSSARQLYLSNLLAPGVKAFNYWHVPLLHDDKGNRMSKRDGSDSAAQWQLSGRSAEQLVGQFAYELGLSPNAQAISSQDLLQSLDYGKLHTAITQRNS